MTATVEDRVMSRMFPILKHPTSKQCPCDLRDVVALRGGFLDYATYATQGSRVKFYVTHVTYATQRNTLRKNYASNATHVTQLES